MNGKIIPTGVKVIAVLYFIISAILIILGIFSILVGGLTIEFPILGTLGSAMFKFMGFIVLGLSILYFFTGRGLWKGKNWARIVAIIFAIIGLINSLIPMFSQQNMIGNVLGLIINGFMGGYLIFNSKAKDVFSSQ